MDLPKVEIKKILYATDLSENARYAFAYAVSLSNLYGASITLMHVLHEVPELVDTHVIGYISEARWEEIKTRNFEEARETLVGKRRDHEAIREVLGQFCKDAEENPECVPFAADEIVVKYGNPAEQILLQAKESQCDLIVMGSHGHKTLADTLLGNTARRVIRRSKIPVLLVRLPEED